MLKELKEKLFKKTKAGALGANAKKYLAFVRELGTKEITEFHFVIYSDDVKGAARPRHRTFTSGSKVFTTTYDPTNNKKFKTLVRDSIREVLPKGHKLVKESIDLKMDVYKKMPNNFSLLKKVLAEEKFIVPCKKPDVDNYAKLPMDAMNEVIYEDDVYVTKLEISKYYSLTPRLEIHIKTINHNECG